MAQVDVVAAAKASLELLILENQSLLEHFTQLIANLDALEGLPIAERHAKLKELEKSGAFQFGGIDIRRFQNSPTRALPPREFLIRTRRRLENTLTLMRDLVQRKPFEAGPALVAELAQLVAGAVDESNTRAVVAFRDSVETLRNSPPFLAYLDVRKSFLKADPEFRAQVEFVSTKESVADGEQTVRARSKDLERIQTGMQSGKITPYEVQDALDDLPPLS